MTDPRTPLRRRDFLTTGAAGGAAALSVALAAPAAAAATPAADAPAPKFAPGWNKLTLLADLQTMVDMIVDTEPDMADFSLDILKAWENRETNNKRTPSFWGFAGAGGRLTQVASASFKQDGQARSEFRLGPMAVLPISWHRSRKGRPNTRLKRRMTTDIQNFHALLLKGDIIDTATEANYFVCLPSPTSQSPISLLFRYAMHNRVPDPSAPAKRLNYRFCTGPNGNDKFDTFLYVGKTPLETK